MAVHFPTNKATFIHVPKTGGTSFYNWIELNVADYIKPPTINLFSNGSIAAARDMWGDLGTVFTFARNPYSRLVSMFFYHYELAQRRLKTDVKPSIAFLKTVAVSSKGFDYWLECMYFQKKELFSIGDANPNQLSITSWFTGTVPDIVIKMENFESEFKQIQDVFGCYAPLPHLNTSDHRPYREYYNSTTKRWVEEMFADDLHNFKYVF